MYRSSRRDYSRAETPPRNHPLRGEQPSMPSLPSLRRVKPARRRSLRVAKLILLGAILVHVTSFVLLRWNNWSLVDYVSIVCLPTATGLAWLACLTVIRQTETDLRKCHDDMEATWQRRHNALLAREQEILRKMDAACAALDIEVPEPEAMPERPALYVAWDSAKQDAG